MNQAHLRVRLNLEPATTEMTLTPEGEDRCRVVHPNLLLLGIIPHAHTDVRITVSTTSQARQVSLEPQKFTRVKVVRTTKY